MLLMRLNNWLTLKDLDKALDDGRVGVISRFARGNVCFQNGGIIDQKGLESLQSKGDSAAAELEKSQRKYTTHGEPRRVRL